MGLGGGGGEWLLCYHLYHRGQPNISFPKREFGKISIVKRSFQWQWFSKWQWLHYDVERDLAFCHTCVEAVKTGKIKSLGTGDLAFVSRGYCNWKDATGNKGAFNTHEKSATHKMAVECLVTFPTSYRNVWEMLSSQYALDKQNGLSVESVPKYAVLGEARNSYTWRSG